MACSHGIQLAHAGGALILAGCLLLASCASVIEHVKCGPNGTVDWDPNPADAPPHCNGG